MLLKNSETLIAPEKLNASKKLKTLNASEKLKTLTASEKLKH